MELQMATVRQVVAIWNQLFPGNRGQAQLELLEKTFYRSMQRTFNDGAFRIAAEMVLRETKFFPTIKDMFDLRNAVYQVKNNMVAKNGETKALPEDTCDLTPEETAQNVERIQIIIRQISGELSTEEAIQRQNELTTWVLSGQN